MPPPPKYFQIELAMSPASPRPKPHPKSPKPLLRLELRDLSLPGARSFLAVVDAHEAMEDAVNGTLEILYSRHSTIPPTRSVTLIIESMPGVAYTTGKDIDNDHKEIHFSTNYIEAIPEERLKQEILGVIRHEMVHCWQWNAKGTAPGGLIEGIADFVRLRSNLGKWNWQHDADGDWDAGYQHTAYFLDYLEKRFGDGSVMAINETLRDKKYEEDAFWQGLFGYDVKTLWKEYGKTFKDAVGKGKEAELKESQAENPTALQTNAVEGDALPPEM